MLTSIPPFGDIFFLSTCSLAHGDIPLALRPRLPLAAIFLWPCSLARPSRRYSFGLAASLAPHGDIPSASLTPHGDIPLALRLRSPPLGDIPSALWPCLPLTVIFLWPCGLARPLTAKLIFYSPHGECRFYFSYAPSRRNQFSIRLTTDVVFITLPPPHGNISFAPHGANQFSLRLILPTRWFAPLGGNQCYLCFWRRYRYSLASSRWQHHLFGLAAAPLWRYQTHQSLSSPPHRFLFSPSCWAYWSMQQRAFCVSPTLTQGFRSSVLVLLLLWRHLTSCLLHLLWCSFNGVVHWRWCCFSCDARQRMAFGIFSDASSRLLFICDGVPLAVTPWTNGLLCPFWCSLTRMTGHALASDDPWFKWLQIPSIP